MKNMTTQKLTSKIIVYALLICGSAMFFTPFIWLIATSLKPIEQTMQIPMTFIPKVYYIDYNGQRMNVSKERELDEDGYIVKILEGPKKDFIIYIPDKDYVNGEAFVEIQKQDMLLMEPFKAQEIKRVKAGWMKVVEKFDEIYIKDGDAIKQVDLSFSNAKILYKIIVGKITLVSQDVEPQWTCVPKNQILENVDFKWSNYIIIFNAIPFFRFFLNTMKVAIIGTIATTLSSAFVAYGFARINWKGRDLVFILCLATMMIPFPVTMIPLYTIFKKLGMVGTLQPLWVPAFFAGAFNIFLLRQFFMTLPKDISEAACIDGCSEFQIFYKIILPLSKPALAVVALFHFMYAWNDFMGPLIYLNKQETYTLALGLRQFQSKQGGTEWHLLMAGSVLIIMPIIVLFFFAQKTFIQGIALTGTKG